MCPRRQGDCEPYPAKLAPRGHRRQHDAHLPDQLKVGKRVGIWIAVLLASTKIA
jgi:hypothetical protein